MDNTLEQDQQDQIQQMMGYIRQTVPTPALCEAIAEEATELAQAALKYARILRNENPTPANKVDVMKNLSEEVGDVMLCLDVCNIGPDRNVMAAKLERWVQRVQENQNAMMAQRFAQMEPEEPIMEEVSDD